MAKIASISPVRQVSVENAEDYEPPEVKIAISDNRHEFCAHETIKIFEHHRIVVCRECGAKLDPFTWLLDMGKRESGVASGLPFLKYQYSHMEKEIESLRNQLSKLKSAIKKT